MRGAGGQTGDRAGEVSRALKTAIRQVQRHVNEEAHPDQPRGTRATTPFAAALEAGKQLGAPDFGLADNADLICVKHAFPDEGILAAGYAE